MTADVEFAGATTPLGQRSNDDFNPEKTQEFNIAADNVGLD